MICLLTMFEGEIDFPPFIFGPEAFPRASVVFQAESRVCISKARYHACAAFLTMQAI